MAKSKGDKKTSESVAVAKSSSNRGDAKTSSAKDEHTSNG